MAEEGTVKYYNEEKGFGFIARGGKEDLFFHKTDWDSNTQPTKGMEVEFSVGSGRKGPAAKYVQPVSEAEAERKAQAAREAEAEQKRLAEEQRVEALKENIPQVLQILQPHLPLSYQQKVDLGEGWSAHNYTSKHTLVEVGENGPRVRVDQTAILRNNKSYVEKVNVSTEVVGWEQMNPRAKYGGPSYKVLPEKGAAEVSFSSPVQVTITCKATPQAPRINEKDNMVEQPVLVETPWGSVGVRIRIYQNPNRGFGGGENWGFDTEVAEKKAELDRQVAGRLHMADEMPEVEFKVTNWVDTYRVGGSWESTDGYMAGDSSHTESVRRGGVSLTVWSPFLQTATDEFHRETGREGVGAVISVRGMATREAVEKAAKELISRAVKHWNLQSGAGEQYAEKLLAHIISHVPKFQSMGGLWVVDEDADRVGQLMLGIPHGLTVMEFEQIGGTNPYLPNEVASRAVRVINRLYAEKYGIPGALAEGELVVYWPEGQKDPTSPEDLAERIRAIVKPDPWKSSPEERWFPEFATPKDVEYAERLLEQFGYQEGGSGWGRQYWVDKASAFLLRLETELKPELLELGRRQEVGEVLVNWKRGRRRQGAAGNCDAWVVRPDSTCREPDRVGNERHTRSLFWRLVEAEELALSWSGGRTGEVAKLPVGGCTPEQLAAVSEVEKELGLEPNSFGLNAEAGQAQEKLVEAATAVLLQKSKVFRRLPQTLEYHLLVSPDGQFVNGKQMVWDERTNEERVDNSWLKRSLQSLDKGTSTATATIANRAAQLVEAFPLKGGILEVWLFNKYGHWNLAIRWRELAEGEVPGLANEVNPDNPMAQALRKAGLA